MALFRLARTLKYKAKPGRGLEQLKSELLLLMDGLENLAHGREVGVPLLVDGPEWVELRRQVVAAQRKADLRRAEDPIDAVVCAYVALYAERRPDRHHHLRRLRHRMHRHAVAALRAFTPVKSDPHGRLVDGCEHVNEIDQRPQRRRAWISAFNQG